MEFIIRDGPVGDRLADLGLDSAQRRRAIQLVTRLVEESFGDRREQFPEREARNRVRVLWRWFAVMYGELGYTLRRCQETLPVALACELAGMSYSPPENLQNGYVARKKGDIPWTQL